jgi:hypothetical protein
MDPIGGKLDSQTPLIYICSANRSKDLEVHRESIQLLHGFSGLTTSAPPDACRKSTTIGLRRTE